MKRDFETLSTIVCLEGARMIARLRLQSPLYLGDGQDVACDHVPCIVFGLAGQSVESDSDCLKG